MDKKRWYNYEAMEQGKAHSLIAIHLLHFQTRGDPRVFMGWGVLASLYPYTIMWWWEGNEEVKFWWKMSLVHPLQMKAPLITIYFYPWDECSEFVKLWPCGGPTRQKIEQFSVQNQLVARKDRPCLILAIHYLGSKKDLQNEIGKAVPVIALPGFSRLIFLDVYQCAWALSASSMDTGWRSALRGDHSIKGGQWGQSQTPMVKFLVLLILPAEYSCIQRQPGSIGGFLLLKKMCFPLLSQELNFYNNKWNNSMLNKSPGLEVGQSI